MSGESSKTTRRDFIKAIGAGTLSFTVSGAQPDPRTQARGHAKPRPNVILVLTDDQGYGDLGCHGNKAIRTPALDKLSKQSMRLTNFYVCPLCSPTRASLMTGRYNYRTGVVDTWVGLALMRSEEVTIAEVLQKAGYRTGVFGKWHLGDDFPLRPMDQGFEECLIHKGAGIGGRSNPPGNQYYDPVLFHNGQPKKYSGYCTDIFFGAALDFVEKHREQTFFAYIATNVPHVPLEIRDDEVKPYLDQGLDETTARHYAMLTNLDVNVDRLLRRLDELKLADDTIVIFMSDNGPAYGNRYNAGLRDIKGSVYDGGIRVPFFIRWPRMIRAGRENDRIAAHIDVLPTVLDLCGLPSSGLELDGISLVPVISGKAADWPDRTLFFQQCRPDSDGIDEPRLFTHCAARTQRYKIVMTAKNSRERNTKAIGVEETELYDMALDPGEAKNTSRDHPEVVLEMRRAYERWFREVTKGLGPVFIALGAREENPVTLNNQDLSGPGSTLSYSSWSKLSKNAEEEPEGYGVWNVQVVRDGNYRITFRFGPVNSGKDIPFKAGKAFFKFGDVSYSGDIESGSTRTSFALRLKKMKGPMETSVTGQRRDGKAVTPFFVDVEYLGD